MNCQYCNSDRIEKRVQIVDNNYGESVGIKYKKVNGLMNRVSKIYCDICLECGAIIKSYIDLPEDAVWIKDR